MPKKRNALLLLLFLGVCVAGAQHRASFDLTLVQDFESAEKTLELYEGLYGRPGGVADLRGSQIALATTALLAQRRLSTADLERSLEAVKFNQDLGDDVFRMGEGRANAGAIRELLNEVRRRSFAERVIRTVEQLFPPSAAVKSRVPVYFVAFGHHNIDAFVRRVVWKGDEPQFVGEGRGELTIVMNLSKAVYYGRSIEERFVGVLSVVAHEVFHAAFGVYKDNSSRWRHYTATHRRPIDYLFALTQNEGIAYYLSLIQQTRGKLRPGWEEKVRLSFGTFSRNTEELLSPDVSPRRASDIVRESNTSGYWESYGAMTGMIIARQIDQTLGRAALVETVTLGPNDFFGKYVDLMKRDPTIPAFSPRVVQEIQRLRN
jgi:hypothetical protein